MRWNTLVGSPEYQNIMFVKCFGFGDTIQLVNFEDTSKVAISSKRVHAENYHP